MLSARTQLFLMSVYPLPFSMKSVDGVFGSQIALQRNVQYLSRAGFLLSKRNPDHTATYMFTDKGIMLTELLLRLPDIPEKFKNKVRLQHFDVELPEGK